MTLYKQFGQKITIALISFILGSLWTLAIVETASAYVPYTDYNGVKLKIMHHSINETECIETLDKIPVEFYEDVEYIRVFRQKDDRLGQYHLYSRGIDLISGCDLFVLQEELAHHWQYKMGDNVIQTCNHLGQFWDILDSIESNTEYD